MNPRQVNRLVDHYLKKVFIFNYWCLFNRDTVLMMHLCIHAAGTRPNGTSFVSICCFLCICVIKLHVSPKYLFLHKWKWTRINKINIWIKLHFKSQYIFTAFSVKEGNSWTQSYKFKIISMISKLQLISSRGQHQNLHSIPYMQAELQKQLSVFRQCERLFFYLESICASHLVGMSNIMSLPPE